MQEAQLKETAHALDENRGHVETPVSQAEDADQLSNQLRNDLADAQQNIEAERTRLESELSDERKLVVRRSQELTATHKQIEELGSKLEETAHELDESKEYGETLTKRVEKGEQVSDTLRKDLTDAQGKIEEMQAWREAFERRPLVRAWRRVQGLMRSPSDDSH